jgi:Holliday junction resolvase
VKVPPDDLHRLLQETLTELGWDADIATVAQQVRRLDIGLPVEDEFAVICAWLGKLKLLHKLDQHQLPRSSNQTYQVPDLLARFETQKGDSPVLIEVKRKSSNTLSFKPEYLAKLQNYSELVGMPLLIAWKFHSLWFLFDATHLRKAKKNFNISFSDAMAENLLGDLAGDVAYKIGSGAGVHLRMKKEKLISVEENDAETTEQWQMRIDHVEFTDREGEVAANLSSEVQSLFTTWDLETLEEH